MILTIIFVSGFVAKIWTVFFVIGLLLYELRYTSLLAFPHMKVHLIKSCTAIFDFIGNVVWFTVFFFAINMFFILSTYWFVSLHNRTFILKNFFCCCDRSSEIKFLALKFVVSANHDLPQTVNNCSTGNSATIVFYSVVASLFSNLERRYATTFYTNFLSRISMSNSCNKSTHLNSEGFESPLVNKYLRVTRYIKTIITLKIIR